LEIPAGIIPARVPRPLTEEEKARTVTPEKLEALANHFAKPQRDRSKPQKPAKKSAWQQQNEEGG
jgi:hypothetical protein